MALALLPWQHPAVWWIGQFGVALVAQGLGLPQARIKRQQRRMGGPHTENDLCMCVPQYGCHNLEGRTQPQTLLAVWTISSSLRSRPRWTCAHRRAYRILESHIGCSQQVALLSNALRRPRWSAADCPEIRAPASDWKQCPTRQPCRGKNRRACKPLSHSNRNRSACSSLNNRSASQSKSRP
jgi:hypothetical protein